MRFSLLLLFAVLLTACTGTAAERAHAGGVDLQNAAKTAFERWAVDNGEPYRNVVVNVTANDGYFATIQVAAQFRPAADASWSEQTVASECKQLGEVWECSEQFVFSTNAGNSQQVELAITATPLPASTAVPTGRVLRNNLQVRTEPFEESPPFGSLYSNQNLTIVGQTHKCEWLQIITPDGTNGWIETANNRLIWNGDCMALPLGIFRPASAAVSRINVGGGPGKLRIENGNLQDAVAILTKPNGERTVSAYIRSGETALVSHIPNDIYELYFSTGADWNGKIFTYAAKYRKFVDLLDFSTPTERKYTGWEVTLSPVSEGNAPTVPVDDSEFPLIDSE